MYEDGAGNAESLRANATGSRIQRRKLSPLQAAGFARGPKRPGTPATLGGWGALVLVAAAVGILARPAAGGLVHFAANPITFYGDIGNVINSRYRKNPLLIRPSELFLTEDGSVALVDLRWSGWGKSRAHAVGVWSASNCLPNCAVGKRTTSPARLTLSSPGLIFGHRVYRCFELSVASRPQTRERECIRRQGTFYGYKPTSAPVSPAKSFVGFYSLPGWYCGMSAHGVLCEHEEPKGETVLLSPEGKVAICRASRTPANPNPCGIGNPSLSTPSLSLGKQVSIPPFRCTHSTGKLTCVVVETGHGFLIHKMTVGRVAP